MENLAADRQAYTRWFYCSTREDVKDLRTHWTVDACIYLQTAKISRFLGVGILVTITRRQFENARVSFRLGLRAAVGDDFYLFRERPVMLVCRIELRQTYRICKFRVTDMKGSEKSVI